MALLGTAAMILIFDIDADMIVEHDDWHSHEHLHERLSIPGFLRGSRWVATSAGRRYVVMYEVEDLNTLTSQPYLDRLNDPSPWTSTMMAHYRGMSRGFARVRCSYGVGLGQTGLVVRFSPGPRRETSLHGWLVEEILPTLSTRPGLDSAHLLEAALTPEMTTEQRMRGKDAGVDWVLMVTGYDDGHVEAGAGALSPAELGRHGAINVSSGLYRLSHSVLAQEATTVGIGNTRSVIYARS
jgi:hypothetical protein